MALETNTGFRFANGQTRVEEVTVATKTLTEADNGTCFYLNRAAGIVITLPEPKAGFNCELVIATTFTGTFTVAGAIAYDGLHGCSRIMIYDGTAAPATFVPNGTSHYQFIANADTKGRLVGSRLKLSAIDNRGTAFTKTWDVSGILFGAGTLATPFA